MTLVKKMTYTALFAAIGILLPQVFHMLGGQTAGGTFLPMHIPVMAAGMLLGPVTGCVVGVLCPVLSSLLTGMPPLAKLPFMALELLAYGSVSGYLTVRRRWNVYPALVVSMAVGRLVNAAALWVAGSLLHWSVPAVYSVVASAVTGIPGIAIQLIFVPVIVLTCRKVMANER